MKEGLLWFDDNPGRDLAEKIRRAARRYREKFGIPPNICHVHQTALSKPQKIDGIHVAPLSTVLPHHFWIGVEMRRKVTQ